MKAYADILMITVCICKMAYLYYQLDSSKTCHQKIIYMSYTCNYLFRNHFALLCLCQLQLCQNVCQVSQGPACTCAILSYLDNQVTRICFLPAEPFALVPDWGSLLQFQVDTSRFCHFPFTSLRKSPPSFWNLDVSWYGITTRSDGLPWGRSKCQRSLMF